MNLNMVIGIFSVVLGIAKEVLIIFILVKGIQIANVYLRKNKNEKVEDNKDKENREDNTENTEDKEDK